MKEKSGAGVRVLKYVGPLIGLSIFCIAVWVLYHDLQTYRPSEIFAQIAKVPFTSFLLSVLLAGMSYGFGTGYDALAARYIGRRIPMRRTALAAFISNALANSLGFALLTGGSIRLRMYSAWDLSVTDITKIVFFYSVSLWLGFFTLGGVVFMLRPVLIPATLHLPFRSVQPLGVLFLLGVTTYFMLALFLRKPLKIRDIEVTFPSHRLFAGQTLISILDWTCAGTSLFVVLRTAVPISFPAFFGIYLLALIASLISQVPAGLGVFETVFVVLLAGRATGPVVLGLLLVYRAAFYLIPLVISVILLGSVELTRRRARLRRLFSTTRKWSSTLVPSILTALAFLNGVLLLFSGAIPEASGKLAALLSALPLPVIETSHFLASITGISLLFFARAIQRRLAAAYAGTVVCLIAAAVFSMLKGLIFIEVILSLVMLIILVPSRAFFYRKSSILSLQLTPRWIALILFAVISAVWLSLFAYNHLSYSSSLWWDFDLDADAPRSLRALAGVAATVVALVVAAVLRNLHERRAMARAPVKVVHDDLRNIVQSTPEARANLALLGNKRILTDDRARGLIMYGITGKNWVSLGDPAGDESEWPELIWRFRELADRYGGRTVFYDVGTTNLHYYRDIGLTPVKIGEQARVPLQDFSLDEPSRRSLRHLVSKFRGDGYIFRVIPRNEVTSSFPDLRRVWESWKSVQRHPDRSFATVPFSAESISQFPVAVVERDHEIAAFASIWEGGMHRELATDIYRQTVDGPQDLVSFAYIELMLWGAAQHYEWLNLGLAPLADWEEIPPSDRFRPLAAVMYNQSGRFPTLKSLRRHKEKFNPVWETRYLASPGGLVLPFVLAAIADLWTGGATEERRRLLPGSHRKRRAT